MNPPLAEILEVGQMIQLTADVRDPLGKRITNVGVTWETLNPSVATVDYSGRVTGMGEGIVEIRGSYSGVSATAVVAVSRPLNKGQGGDGESVTIFPDQDTVRFVGGNEKLLAIGRNKGGQLVGAKKLTWSTEDGNVATVDGDGIVTGRKTGQTLVIVQNGTAADTSQVWVAPSDVAVAVVITPQSDTIPTVGTVIGLQAQAVNGSGDPLDGAQISWTTLDPSIATVTAGNVLGVKKGVARIVASYNTLADTATVWVEPVLAATSLYVEPKADTIPQVGETLQLKATLLDGSGASIPQSVTWGTMDAAVASVSSSGLVKGVSSGLARITARYNTLVDTAKIWVAPAPPTPLFTVEASPGADTVALGATVLVKAFVRNSKGILVDEALPTWMSLDTGTATVSGSGPIRGVDVRGVKAGTARIVATYAGAVDTATVTVSTTGTGTGSGYTTVINPDPATIPAIGATLRIRWDVYDSTGTLVPEVYPTWQSLDPTIAAVQTGPVRAPYVTGIAKGTTQLVATWNGTVDTATVIVENGSGTGGSASGPTVTVSPAYTSVLLGATTTLAAAAQDSAGNAVPSSQLAWQSLDAGTASVSAAGVVTGLSTGSARIRVSWSSAADTAIVYVNQPLPTGGSSLTPAPLVPVAGPLVPRASAAISVVNAYDNRYATAEQATYDAWVAGGQSGADGSSHYGALRSRYQWSIRNGLAVGPSAPSNSPYKHGVAMTRAFLNKYAQPNNFKIAPHNNTAMADVELLYRMEGDAVALAHIKNVATFYAAAYLEYYFDLTGPNSDPRSSAILLQSMSAAHRLGLPYTGRPSWGSSWPEAGQTIVTKMAAQIPASGKVTSLAHKNTGQGDEAFFMNAMLATELLRWHAFVQPQPSWVSLAQRIVDHLIDEYNRRGAACLPYTSNKGGCAADLASFYVWPALVLWQETGDSKYQTFALQNLSAARNAYLAQAKIFNQTYSTGAESAEALLLDVIWR